MSSVDEDAAQAALMGKKLLLINDLAGYGKVVLSYLQTQSWGMIEINLDNVDKYKGIPVETCLEVIKE